MKLKLRHVLPLALLATLGCDEVLEVQPVDEIAEEEAITNAESAEAALIGAYSALTSTSYYGGTMIFMGDLSADNAEHTGTLQAYATADGNDLRADNGAVETIWNAIYRGIARANVVLAQVPEVEMDQNAKARILGEAHLLRALHYHNLVKLWGGVPIRTAPAQSVDDASQIARSTEAEVYAQIRADLQAAEQLLSQAGDLDNTRRATLGAVYALRSRVLLYMEDWAGAEQAADAAAAFGYELAPDFSALFSPDGQDTPEDIFRVDFTAVDYNNIGYYYIAGDCGQGSGRGELAPTEDLAATYSAADVRGEWTLDRGSDGTLCGTRYPTTAGAEDVHVIRYGEVLLNKAEAEARQNELADAVATYNQIRVRAGLAPHVFGVDVTTQQEVLEEIWLQRRLELATEGDRWADLVRTDRADEVLGLSQDEMYQTLYPIPQSEISVAPNLDQNPDY